MIRRHATWIRIHPRSATSYLAYSLLWRSFYRSDNTLLRTCWGPFGIPQLLGLERRARRARPTSIRGSGLGRQRRVEDNAPYQLRPGGGYLMLLSAALVASRKAVPTNVKDQPPRPFTGKTKSLYPIIWAKTRGNSGNSRNLPISLLACCMAFW